jgi:hypothetical protein
MITRQILIYGGLAVGAVGLVLLLKNKNKSGGLLEGLGIDTEGETTEVPKSETPKPKTPPLATNPIADIISIGADNLNMASVTLLFGQRNTAFLQSQEPAPDPKSSVLGNLSFARLQWALRVDGAKAKVAQLDKQLNALGYKVDEEGKLVKL